MEALDWSVGQLSVRRERGYGGQPRRVRESYVEAVIDG
jgi:hypothetical protein